MKEFREVLIAGKDVAFVIHKRVLTDAQKIEYNNENRMTCEEIIHHIVKENGEDPIIRTMGKASRELFDTRVEKGQSHKYDFLTVDSMGYALQSFLWGAINKPDYKI